MSEYKPQDGDRVRVVYEGVVGDADTLGFLIREEGKDTVPFFFSDAGLVSVEKIKPPAEVFGPGDVVRDKATGSLYSIGHDGYLSHQTHGFYEWYPGGACRPNYFDSRGYEKVEIG